MSRGYRSVHLSEGGTFRPAESPRTGSSDIDRPLEGSQREIVERLREEIEREGRITFSRFMSRALYEPVIGYYSASDERPTRGGDYLTAPELHPIFGHALARQLDEMWRRLDEPDPFVLREYGGGRGTLAVTILEGLRADGSPLAESLRYELVELGGRSDIALDRIASAGFASAVERARGDGAAVGCVLANEFLDALPVHRVVALEGELCELYVTWRDGWFADEPGPLSSERLRTPFAASGVSLPEGQQAEVNLGIAGWVGEVAERLGRGYVVVIDYGHPAHELYSPRRRLGTLLGYRGHTVSSDPYAAVGRQDLTAHVDLTALERAAQEAGLDVLGRTTQAEMLVGLGLGDLLTERQSRESWPAYRLTRAAVLRLVDPAALGGFAVTVLGTNVPLEPQLRGLAFRLPRPVS